MTRHSWQQSRLLFRKILCSRYSPKVSVHHIPSLYWQASAESPSGSWKAAQASYDLCVWEGSGGTGPSCSSASITFKSTSGKSTLSLQPAQQRREDSYWCQTHAPLLRCSDLTLPCKNVFRNVACESRHPWVHLFVLVLISENMFVFSIADISPL